MLAVPALAAEQVPVAQISAGDTAWLLSATALVLLMTLPGLALFYAGMVRKKNILAVMAQTLACAALVTLLWFACGYSLAFEPGPAGLERWIGGLGGAGLGHVLHDKAAGLVSVHALMPSVPAAVFALFQLSFAIITPCLIIGAVAERMRFASLLAFLGLWSLFVYVPVAHWVWAPQGWLAQLGALDFAGGTVVHVNAGVAGLVAAWMLGPRVGFGHAALTPANLAFTMTGAGLLWVGWIGFNGGSAGAADERAGIAVLNTQLGAAAAALSWMAAEWVTRRTPTLLGRCSGAVAGLVAMPGAAIWAEQRNVGDLAVLRALLAEAGLEAALMDRIADPAIAARYADYTAEARDLGVFGAPSYVIDGEIFWGQDRLDFVERRLRG